MESRPKHNLDNPTFRGRLRGSRHAVLLDRPHSSKFNGHMSDIHVDTSSKPKPKVEPAAPAAGQAPAKHPAADIKPADSFKPNLNPKVPEPLAAKTVPAHNLNSRPHLPKQKRSNVLKRQMLKPIQYTHVHKHRRPLVPTLLSGMAVLLFAAGVLVLINTLRTNHSVKAQIKQLSQAADGDTGISEGTPSEANPPSDANISGYQVASDLPRLLTINKINVSARIRKVGAGQGNILKAPANIFDAGWYDGSAKPGENGTVVLDGHVSGPTKHGIFYSLGTLKAGDKINIERGDGKKFTYTVTGTQLFDNDKVDMSKVITSSVPGKPGLNLMTCAGRFNTRTNQFEQRVVVYTTQD